MNRFTLTVVLLLTSLHAAIAQYQYPEWQHRGSLYVLTTPEGADLPAASSEQGFPLLVRLHRDFFDFAQTQPHGEDIRFSTSSGVPLAFQVDTWDPANGTASVWIRLPVVRGNERQEIRMHWGNATASSASSGASVFDVTNGYLAVWHMNDPVRDELGAVASKDVGTTPAAGVVGQARHLAGDQGISGGDALTNFPTGASPHSSEAWFRAARPNSSILAWGNEHAQGKVVMQFRSPPHINMDCYFSGANVASSNRLPLNEWVHVVHTYEKGDSRLYVNGVLKAISKTTGAPLAIKRPARLWLGGWYDHYDFVGDLDEVRMSSVARSADWIRLQHENQKPLQTLAGLLVPPGDGFSVSPSQATVLEGRSATFSATAGGAQKIYWILKRDGRETTVAVDRLHYTFDAGRVTRDATVTLQLRAVCANGVRTLDIPITVREDIPEPVFSLKAPATWNGRQTIEIVPQIANAAAMESKGAAKLEYSWSLAPIAVIKDILPGKLVLTRAQNSGELAVTLTAHNGGQATTQTVTIQVREPKKDAWVSRMPAPDEKPQDNQFYARDDRNEGTLFCNGTVNQSAESVFLRVYADGKPYKSASRPAGLHKTYAFSVKLKPGLIHYSVECGIRMGGREKLIHSATNLVCGDAYIIQGQSNAVSTDWGEGNPTYHSEWIRSFGSMSGNPEGLRLWGEAVHRSRDEEKLQIGYWGMEFARRLLEEHKIPICILNGAIGGTRIDQHQRNPENPTDMTTLYGRLLWRAQQAGLTHGIRGVLWHQGENDQGADGPSGGFGWETYRRYFIDLAAAWKQDFPNIQQYYVFQIWPKACAMGVNGSDNRLREVQRTLPAAFSRLSVMSTLGIDPPGGCHYPAAGYAEIARLITPLVQRDHYGKRFDASITPPNLKRARFSTTQRNALTLEFDQPVVWNEALASQFFLDGEKGKVLAGSVAGNTLTLSLAESSSARTLTYLDSKAWKPGNVLRGANGIAALTFCEVSLQPAGE